MTETYEFDHELPSGQECHVEAEITTLIPARINCLPEDAYPAEGGYAEITQVTVYEGELDMSDTWIRTKGKNFVLFLDDLAETAYDQWSNNK